MGAADAFTLIGDPDLNRTQGFVRAANSAGVDVVVWPYSRALAGDWPSAASGRTAWTKIESPGRNPATHQLLLNRGANRVESCFSTWLEREPFPLGSGLVRASRQWFHGWCDLLQEIDRVGAACGLNFVNAPPDIVTMFDKAACHALLQAAGVPVPVALAPPQNLDELLATMEKTSTRRVFVKTCHGSAANGVVALAMHRGGLRAHTALELARRSEQMQLHATRRVRVYDTPAQVRQLIDALCRERVHVEEWVPKAGLLGRTIDVRVVVISDRACHVVLRGGHGPITNLHLGSIKADEEILVRAAGSAGVNLVRTTAERAAACFPKSRCMGIDLALTPGFRKAFVLEVNAFGDLLEGSDWLGADTYTWQVRALLKQDWPPPKSQPTQVS